MTQKDRLNAERFNEKEEQQEKLNNQYRAFVEDRRGYERELNIIERW